MTRADVLPGFFVIGAPKCGTSSLNRYLDQHPGIEMFGPPEPHCFDVHYEEDPASFYRGLLPDERARARADLLRGDTTPEYLYPVGVEAALHEHVPDAKLIVLLRDPVERAHSDWWMMWCRGVETLGFEEAIGENLSRLANGSTLGREAWRAKKRSPRDLPRTYVDMGHYEEHLRRWMQHFPQERLSIHLTSDLADSPEDTMASIFTFLGVKPVEGRLDYARENEAWHPATRPLHLLWGWVKRHSPIDRLPDPVRLWFVRNFTGASGRPPVPEPTRTRLAEHYQPKNKQLEKLLDQRLDGWTQP